MTMFRRRRFFGTQKKKIRNVRSSEENEKRDSGVDKKKSDVMKVPVSSTKKRSIDKEGQINKSKSDVIFDTDQNIDKKDISDQEKKRITGSQRSDEHNYSEDASTLVHERSDSQLIKDVTVLDHQISESQAIKCSKQPSTVSNTPNLPSDNNSQNDGKFNDQESICDKKLEIDKKTDNQKECTHKEINLKPDENPNVSGKQNLKLASTFILTNTKNIVDNSNSQNRQFIKKISSNISKQDKESQITEDHLEKNSKNKQSEYVQNTQVEATTKLPSKEDIKAKTTEFEMSSDREKTFFVESGSSSKDEMSIVGKSDLLSKEGSSQTLHSDLIKSNVLIKSIKSDPIQKDESSQTIKWDISSKTHKSQDANTKPISKSDRKTLPKKAKTSQKKKKESTNTKNNPLSENLPNKKQLSFADISISVLPQKKETNSKIQNTLSTEQIFDKPPKVDKKIVAKGLKSKKENSDRTIDKNSKKMIKKNNLSKIRVPGKNPTPFEKVQNTDKKTSRPSGMTQKNMGSSPPTQPQIMSQKTLSQTKNDQTDKKSINKEKSNTSSQETKNIKSTPHVASELSMTILKDNQKGNKTTQLNNTTPSGKHTLKTNFMKNTSQNQIINKKPVTEKNIETQVDDTITDGSMTNNDSTSEIKKDKKFGSQNASLKKENKNVHESDQNVSKKNTKNIRASSSFIKGGLFNKSNQKMNEISVPQKVDPVMEILSSSETGGTVCSVKVETVKKNTKKKQNKEKGKHSKNKPKQVDAFPDMVSYVSNYMEILEGVDRNATSSELTYCQRRALLTLTCDFRHSPEMEKRFLDADTNHNIKSHLWSEIAEQTGFSKTTIKNVYYLMSRSFNKQLRDMRFYKKVGKWKYHDFASKKAPILVEEIEKFKKKMRKKAKKHNKEFTSYSQESDPTSTESSNLDSADDDTVNTDTLKQNKILKAKEASTKNTKNTSHKNSKDALNLNKSEKDVSYKNAKESINKNASKKKTKVEMPKEDFYEDLSDFSSLRRKKRRRPNRDIIFSNKNLKTFENTDNSLLLKLINDRDSLIRKLLNLQEASEEIAVEIAKKEETIDKLLESSAHKNVYVRNVRRGLRQ